MKLNGGSYSFSPFPNSGLVVPGLAFSPPQEGAIYHIKTKNYLSLRFEWHPQKKNVYVVREIMTDDGRPTGEFSGELVAFNIEDHGAAQNAVLIWLRGYQTATTDRAPVPFLKAEDY